MDGLYYKCRLVETKSLVKTLIKRVDCRKRFCIKAARDYKKTFVTPCQVESAYAAVTYAWHSFSKSRNTFDTISDRTNFKRKHEFN